MVELRDSSRFLRFLSYARRVFFPCLVSFFLWGLSAHASTARVELMHSQDRYEAGKGHPFLFRIHVSKGWYLHGPGEDDKGMIPTRISFEEPAGIKVGEVLFPLPEFVEFEYADHPIQTFSGQVPVSASLIISDDTPPGEHMVRGLLSYQACSISTCLPPEEERFTMAVTVVPKGAPTRSLNRHLFLHGDAKQTPLPAGLWLSLIGFFLGGLALNLTPCIYPLIPITVSYFGGRTRSGNTFFQAGLYLFGLSVTNSLLGLWAALSGRLLGSILQNPLVVVLMACLFIVLALSFFGVWEFRLPSWLTRSVSKTYGGYFGAFFMGLTLGIVAAPCLGPFILGLLTYVAQIGNPWVGFLSFFFLSLGLGLPLAVLALFSGALERLPLSGDWMVWIRKLMGWILVAMAIYMVRPLIPSELGRSALTALVPILASFHLCWFDRSGLGAKRFLLFKRAMGIVLVAAAFVYFGLTTHSGPAVSWVPYEEAVMERAQGEKPFILDAYADWCVPCLAMDRNIFSDPEVVALSRKAVMIRLDLTRRKTSQEELLKKYGIKGVPTILFFNSSGVELRELRVESHLEKEEFLARFREILPE
jgi:thioredoxin:protein disulfide reductase